MFVCAKSGDMLHSTQRSDADKQRLETNSYSARLVKSDEERGVSKDSADASSVIGNRKMKSKYNNKSFIIPNERTIYNMCGIVGYAGSKEAVSFLVAGLEKLEYRGYDSVGISVFADQQIITEKTKGRVAQLRTLIEQNPLPKNHCGIGHTRWATHGEPSDINSHPHGNHRLSIVHNGIIENYRQIKERMIRKGYTFESETDTETIAKCLDYYLEQKGNPLKALAKVIEKLEGSYALGILIKDTPDTIYAVRKDSPLIIGLGQEENYIASDMTALLKYTKQYYLLEEGEIAIITKDSVSIVDNEDFLPVTKEIQIADWDEEAAEKGGFPHFMLKEIHEQPDAFRKTIAPRLHNHNISFERDGITDEVLSSIKRFYIVACGTAMHAGMIGKNLFERYSRIPVEVVIASEFRYQDPIFREGDCVLVISQSGETADSLAALRLAKEAGVLTLAIVNVVGSSIAREAAYVMQTLGGIEIAVASTKAYYMQLSLLYLLAFKLGRLHNLIPDATLNDLLDDFVSLEFVAADLLNHAKQYQYLASLYQNVKSMFFIGRGMDYSIALESSLKMKEISYINCEAYPAGELKHGTISLITEESTVIALASQAAVFEKTVSNIKEVKARKANVLLVARDDLTVSDDVYDNLISIPSYPDVFMPLIEIIPMQLLAYYMSVLKGNDVDKPRNLAKSVTVE